MSQFTPGKIIKTFTTKSGKTATLAYPKWESLAQLLAYINTLSTEDTFIRLSGEQQTLADEAKYFSSTLVRMELKEVVYLHCFVDGELAGVCEVGKLPELKKRGEHVGRMGISVAAKFRADGIGYELLSTTIAEASRELSGLQLIHLECTGTNHKALNLYKKVGFKEVGRFPKYILYQGQYVDEVEMLLAVNGWEV